MGEYLSTPNKTKHSNEGENSQVSPFSIYTETLTVAFPLIFAASHHFNTINFEFIVPIWGVKHARMA